MRSTFIKVREKRQAILRNAQTIELIKVKTNDRSAKRNLMKKLRNDLVHLTLNTEQQTIKEKVKIKRLKQKRFDEHKSDKLHYHKHLSR
jgi:TusA-related sulfurtransferase